MGRLYELGFVAPSNSGTKNPETERSRFMANITRLAASTIVSRILGLIKNQIQAIMLGTGAIGDAFAFALTIPNLMRRLAGEGALASSFIPVYIDYKDDIDKAKDFAGRFFSLLVFFLFLSIGAVYLAAPALEYLAQFTNANAESLALTVDLVRLMYPYALFICAAALLQGILNSHQSFLPSSLSPIVYNLVFIFTGFLVAPYYKLSELPYIFGSAVLLGGICQFLVQVPFLKKRNLTFKLHLPSLRNPAIRKALGLFGLGAFGAGIYQINVAVSRTIALGAGEGVTSYLTFSNLLIELVQGILIVSVTTVLLPMLGELLSGNNSENSTDNTANKKQAAELFGLSLQLLMWLTVPCTIGLILIGPEIIAVLFQHGNFDSTSTAGVYRALFYHSMGLPLVAMYRVFSQAFYAVKKLRIIVYVSLASMILNIALAGTLGLYLDMKETGIAIASVSSVLLSIVLLLVPLGQIIEFPYGPFSRSLLKSALGATALWFVLVYFRQWVAYPTEASTIEQVVWVVAAIGSGGVVYLAITFWLFRKQVRDFLALRRR